MYDVDNPSKNLTITAFDIDWSTGEASDGVITLGDATVFTFSNVVKNKVISLVVTGDFTLTLPAACTNYTSGDTYDGTVNNLIVFQCIDDTESAEVVWCNITNASS